MVVNFGDTGTSSDQHPEHQYTTPGVYSVSLTATNANGSHTRVLPDLISIPEPAGLLMLAAGMIELLWLDASRRNRRNQGHLIACRVCKED
jgi:hypothetical protein